MSKSIKLTADDVSIEPIRPEECSGCGSRATHRVSIDMRNNGLIETVGGDMCYTCAVRFAHRLQESLGLCVRRSRS